MRPLIGTTVVLGALAFAAGPANAAPQDFASGSASFVCLEDCSGSLAFTGHGTPADAHGTVKIDIPSTIQSRGSVDCVAVDGNRATISGVLDKPSPGLDGPFYALQVEDNGSPGTSGDRISVAFGRFPVQCALANGSSPVFPVSRGNVVVKDNTP
jgi:hypothetical protein